MFLNTFLTWDTFSIVKQLNATLIIIICIQRKCSASSTVLNVSLLEYSSTRVLEYCRVD